MFIQPNQFRIFGIVADCFESSFLEIRTNNPTDVRIPEAINFHSVWISRGIAVAMVMAMMSGPPQHTFLCSRFRHECDYNLKPAGSLIRLVSEVAMITAGHPKHASAIKHTADYPI